MDRRIEKSLWTIHQEAIGSESDGKYETIFTLANGYRGLRGILEFSSYHRRGNFLAGIFNRTDSEVPEIVNCQDPLIFRLTINQHRVDLETCSFRKFQRFLDMEKGILFTEFIVKTGEGKETKVVSERFVSQNQVHRWGVRYQITPLNHTSEVRIESAIDGGVTNEEWSGSAVKQHFQVEGKKDLEIGILLMTKTKEHGIEILEGTGVRVLKDGSRMDLNRQCVMRISSISEEFSFIASQNVEYVIEKYGVTYSSRDVNEEVKETFKKEFETYLKEGLNSEIQRHGERWKEKWKCNDIRINGDDAMQIGVRFNLFQLASSAYAGDPRVSIAAKALHGEGYKGHVFWDTEIFMLPFFIYTNSEVARSLLMYRYHTLPGARINAKENGYRGAQFAWESADNGREATPRWLTNDQGEPFRLWIADEEIHINADIVYGIFAYYQVTRDQSFLKNFGAEIIYEVARFWASRFEYDGENERYELHKVIGPDEFHEHVSNNAYTNHMAKWSLKKAVDLYKEIHQEDPAAFKVLQDKIGICMDEIVEWERIEQKVYLSSLKAGGLIEQFDGYFDLLEVEIQSFDQHGMPILPQLEVRELSETQLIKQADVVMLTLLLRSDFNEQIQRANYDYYKKRVLHKSSLSPSIYAIMGNLVGDTTNAYEYFSRSVMTDLDNNQGNTVEGLHAAATGGVWQSIVVGFAGMHVDEEDRFCFRPWIPEKWDDYSFALTVQGMVLKVMISRNRIVFKSDGELTVLVNSDPIRLQKNQRVIRKLK